MTGAFRHETCITNGLLTLEEQLLIYIHFLKWVNEIIYILLSGMSECYSNMVYISFLKVLLRLDIEGIYLHF